MHMLTPSSTEHLPPVERLTYTLKETQEALGVGESLLAELIRSGRIKVLRLGKRRVLVPRAELERLVAEARAG